jgi:drug/metabolite transporter (DMT)-like permease
VGFTNHTHLSSSRLIATLLLVVAALLWSLTGLAVKIAAMEPVAFVFWRAVGAGATAALITLRTRQFRADPRWISLAVILNSVVAGTVIWMITRTTAANGVLLQYTAPVFCALFAWACQGRRLDSLHLASLAIATLGVCVMAFAGNGIAVKTIGVGLLCGAAFAGLILVFEQLNVSALTTNPTAAVMWMNLGTAILFSLAFGSVLARPMQPAQLITAIATGVFLTALPYVLLQLALRHVPAVEAAMIVLLEPVLGPVWVAIGVGEVPGKATLFGGAAILLAATLQALGMSAQDARRRAAEQCMIA